MKLLRQASASIMIPLCTITTQTISPLLSQEKRDCHATIKRVEHAETREGAVFSAAQAFRSRKKTFYLISARGAEQVYVE